MVQYRLTKAGKTEIDKSSVKLGSIYKDILANLAELDSNAWDRFVSTRGVADFKALKIIEAINNAKIEIRLESREVNLRFNVHYEAVSSPQREPKAEKPRRTSRHPPLNFATSAEGEDVEFAEYVHPATETFAGETQFGSPEAPSNSNDDLHIDDSSNSGSSDACERGLDFAPLWLSEREASSTLRNHL